MNRIEVLEEIIKQKGGCKGISCFNDKCPLNIHSRFSEKRDYECSRFEDDGPRTDLELAKQKNLWVAKELLAKEKKMKKFELIKGKKYEVSNYEDFINSEERIFHEENKGFEYPYNCISLGFLDEYKRKFGVSTVYYKYIREIQPKYKAYTKLSLDWINEKVIYKNKKCIITDIGHDYMQDCLHIVLTDIETETEVEQKFGFELAFKNITRLDNTPFGEKI